MSFSEDQTKVTEALETLIENEVERRIKDYPVYVRVNGQIVDIDSVECSGGQIDVEIKEPIFFAESGKTGIITIKMPRRMAG